MACTGAEVMGFPMGPALRVSIVLVTHDAVGYVAAGETLDLSDIFPNEVYGGHPIEAAAEGGYQVKYLRAALGDPAAGKVVVYTGDYDPAADSPLTLEDGTPNLSAVCTGRWLFYGY